MNDEQRIDLAAGVPLRDLERAIVAGRVGDEDVILLRAAGSLFAVGALCSHYHGALADGLVVGDTIRCPLHHACFSLRTGEALRAPALDAIACWRVEQVGETAFVRERLPSPEPAAMSGEAATRLPASVVIVGAGAAGLSAADTLRKCGYEGPVTMIGADIDAPCDRPNLSKDYLTGGAPDDWMPLRTASFYAASNIELLLDTRVASIDWASRSVVLADGRSRPFGALLLATGADPVRLEVPGASPSQIHTLRTYADGRALLAKAKTAKRALVVGASFIGLEVAASLRERGISVHVVGREAVPMERVLGADVGRFVQALHESHGVVFHLEATLDRIEGSHAILSDGTTLDADLIVMGVGVRPALSLAEESGLTVDRGVVVDEYLQTSQPGVFAAGDIARWPDPHSGERIRVEHWVVAQRQGQIAAMNMLGQRKVFDAVPYFWSQHYDVTISYVGHAERWDTIDVDGSLTDHRCELTYRRAGKVLAVATIGRDLKSLEAEVSIESTSSTG